MGAGTHAPRPRSPHPQAGLTNLLASSPRVGLLLATTHHARTLHDGRGGASLSIRPLHATAAVALQQHHCSNKVSRRTERPSTLHQSAFGGCTNKEEPKIDTAGLRFLSWCVRYVKARSTAAQEPSTSLPPQSQSSDPPMQRAASLVPVGYCVLGVQRGTQGSCRRYCA